MTDASSDRFAVQDLLTRYAQGVDRRNWEQVESCFDPEAMIRGSRIQAPLPEYLPLLKDQVNAFSVTTHFIGNQLFEVSGDSATGDTYALAFHWHADPEQNLLVAVRYHDTFAKRDGVWKIVERAVDADWSLSGAQLPVPPQVRQPDQPASAADALSRQLDELSSRQQIERLIYSVGYHLELGEFAEVGKFFAHATLGADLIGRKMFTGAAEVQGQYERTNIVYPEGGRRTKEIYTNLIVDLDLDAGTAKSVVSYTVAQQIPGETFELLVAGKYFDEFERVDGQWRFTDRYLTVQYKNNLDTHMHPGSQPYN